MDSTERNRIIKDIINHRIEEVEVGAGDSFDAWLSEEGFETVTEYKETLENESDEMLENIWRSNVGEWIAPMQRWGDDEFQEESEPVWVSEGFDNVIEWQFNKVKTEGRTDYGYISPQYTQPY